MFLGVDLGTSGIKVILMNTKGEIVDSVSQSLEVSQPKPLWSEQSAESWWDAFDAAMLDLKSKRKLSDIKVIGLSGQMHGAVLLGANNEVLRPVILWNDGRSQAQCEELEDMVPESREITGNMMMPGFTAPKLLWVKQNEPEIFEKTTKVLLPKDYLRFLLSGDFASDMSDSAGTLWLDIANRSWNKEILAACGLNESHMPNLYEGSEVTGHLHAHLSERWGLPTNLPIVAGAGDNAAGAVGVGLIQPGQGMLSLGTSGVYFVVSDEYKALPAKAVHSFCHALPDTWHLMSVLLSAASCAQWFADSIAEQNVGGLFEQLESQLAKQADSFAEAPIFLPYLSGERTPHNNPNAKGNFFGLSHATTKLSMFYAVLEGVALAFADGVEALHQSGAQASEIAVIGGGAQSPIWRQMLADVLNMKIVYRRGGEVGPALGAARLAQLAINESSALEKICPQPPIEQTHLPNIEKHQHYAKRRKTFIQLYSQLHNLFQ